MDEELFELCRQVYEATKFETGEWFEITENLIVTDEDKYIMEQDTVDTPYDFTPLYTSDYLLEKLPPYLSTYGDDGDDYVMRVQSTFERDSWWAYYLGDDEKMQFHQEASTPLKVLLKLVIALDDAGQLVATETTA